MNSPENVHRRFENGHFGVRGRKPYGLRQPPIERRAGTISNDRSDDGVAGTRAK
jgi:hypothetical protein